MIITKDKLEESEACSEAIVFFDKHYTEIEAGELLKDVLQYQEEVEELGYDIYDWRCWLIVHLLSKTDRVRFAVKAAELVLPVFEGMYPNDDRPRKAIEAAKAWIENPNKETRQAAHDVAYADAAYVAYADAAYDAYDAKADAAANDAANDAAYTAAWAAAWAADAAAWAAKAAYYADAAYYAAYAAAVRAAAYAAAYAAKAAAYYADAEDKILDYGIELLEGENKK